jgi:hypothetical protein
MLAQVYLIYRFVSIAITIWVGRALHKNGRIFLVYVFKDIKIARFLNPSIFRRPLNGPNLRNLRLQSRRSAGFRDIRIAVSTRVDRGSQAQSVV